jgi:hypothetical protein
MPNKSSRSAPGSSNRQQLDVKEQSAVEIVQSLVAALDGEGSECGTHT